MQNGKSGPPHLGVYCATPPVEKRTGYAASGRQRLDSDGIVRDATCITGKRGDQPSSVKPSQKRSASSGEDAPRGLDFLFSRNRLNVAIWRAQCLAYLVCSPRLLKVDCRTIEQMRLANALCRLIELASQA